MPNKLYMSDKTATLTDQAADRGNDERTDADVSATPLQSVLRVWNFITTTGKLRDRYEQASQRLQTLEQDNLGLRDKLEQLTQREANARYLANHDGLTGLCNRSLLMDRFVQAAAHAKRCGHSIALLLFDLDGFKAVNDRFGHLAGDRLLKHMADHLVEIARAGDTICRYGGDEFVVLQPGINNRADAEQVVQRVTQSIGDCLLEDDIKLEVRASCGIALYPEDGENWHDLMEAADTAMCQSKPDAWQSGNADKARDRRMGNRHDRIPTLRSPGTLGATPDNAKLNDKGLATSGNGSALDPTGLAESTVTQKMLSNSL